MFKLLSVFPVALFAASAVSGLVIPRKAPPAGWATSYLEPYDTYHIRYLALDCEAKHNTSFFNQCCHPLLANESLSSRPAQCTPSPSASASASSAEPTSTVTTPADDGDDCDDEPSSTVAAATSIAVTSSSVKSTPSASSVAPVNVAPVPSVLKPSSSATPTSTHTTPKAPTTSATPTHTSTSAAAASPTSNSDLITGGFATFFFQKGNPGACGTVHSDSDLIAAIDQDRYGDSGDASSLCGKQVKITNPSNQKSVIVSIVDDCPTCRNSNSIDLSLGAFTKIATQAEGMVSIVWSFV